MRRGGGTPKEVEDLLLEVEGRVAKLGRDLEAWYVELARLRSLSVKHGLNLHAEHANTFDLADGSVGQAGLPTAYVAEPLLQPNIGDDATGPMVVFPDQPDKHVALRFLGHMISAADLPVMVINLAASDQAIRAAVEHLLRERRSRSPLLRTTGTHSLSRSLRDPHVFDHWRRHRVIELTELLAWRASQPEGKTQHPDHVLGSWLGLDAQRTSKAIGVIRSTLGSLPAILAEVVIKPPNDDPGQPSS